jgi:hypothetical protein
MAGQELADTSGYFLFEQNGEGDFAKVEILAHVVSDDAVSRKTKRSISVNVYAKVKIVHVFTPEVQSVPIRLMPTPQRRCAGELHQECRRTWHAGHHR